MSLINSIFKPSSDQARLLASHLPDGKFWLNKFNQSTNIGKLVAGLAVEFFRIQVIIGDVYTDFDINKTDQLITEWEKSVGIPSNCFRNVGDLSKRRDQILQLFTNFGGVQTENDFLRVAEFFGFSIQILTGTEIGTFPLIFPVMFFDSTRSASHTIFIQLTGLVSGDEFFPLPFPIPFSSGGTTFLKCIFDQLAPANVKIIIVS